MSTNGEDADMAECDGEKVVTMMDVLQEQQEFEDDANAVLGASDDKNCTYSKGYIKRQALYACLTCCDAKEDPTKRAGVCLACSLACHENHDLVELYTKRNFRCDCGNPKFNQPCTYTQNKTQLNDNNYNQNFSGLYCVCHRPYPDPDGIEEEMIQCIICEDWLHASHLEATIPSSESYAEMVCKACMEKNEFLHDYSEYAVNGDVDVVGDDENDRSVCNGDSKTDVGEIDVKNVDINCETKNNGDCTEENSQNITDPTEVTDSSLTNSDNITINKSEPKNSVMENTDDEFENKTNTENVTEDAATGFEDKTNTESVTENIATDEFVESVTTESCAENAAINELNKKASIESENAMDGVERTNSAKNTENDSTDKFDVDKTVSNEQNSSSNTDMGNEKAGADDISATKDDITTDSNTIAANVDTVNITDISTKDDKVENDAEDRLDKNSLGAPLETVGTNDDNTNDAIEESLKKSTAEEESQRPKVTESETVIGDIDTNTNKTIKETNNDFEKMPEKQQVAHLEKCEGSFELNDNCPTDKQDMEVDESSNAPKDVIKDQTKEHKRKLSTEEADDTLSKKAKLETKCMRPKSNKRLKGATFWPPHFRQKLCTCSECITMYKDLSVLFLIDLEDTVTAYETLGKERTNGTSSSSSYEKGLEALSSLDRIQQINALTEYNKMRDKLLDFLKSFKDRREVVKEEDIKAFFAGMKPKREPDGVYFCR